MSGSAIAVMIIAIAVVWGGLAAAIVLLRRHPEQPEQPEEPAGERPEQR